jgi:predicted DNA-binding transcriptional regulator AlpA
LSTRADDDRYLTNAEAAAFLGVSRRTLHGYRTKKPDFPQPVVLSFNNIRWRRQALIVWMEAQRSASPPAEGPIDAA